MESDGNNTDEAHAGGTDAAQAYDEQEEPRVGSQEGVQYGVNEDMIDETAQDDYLQP